MARTIISSVLFFFCSQEETDLFWNQFESILTGIPEGEELIVAGDLNGHVGMDREGNSEMVWRVNDRNEEPRRVKSYGDGTDIRPGASKHPL